MKSYLSSKIIDNVGTSLILANHSAHRRSRHHEYLSPVLFDNSKYKTSFKCGAKELEPVFSLEYLK